METEGVVEVKAVRSPAKTSGAGRSRGREPRSLSGPRRAPGKRTEEHAGRMDIRMADARPAREAADDRGKARSRLREPDRRLPAAEKATRSGAGLSTGLPAPEPGSITGPTGNRLVSGYPFGLAE